MDTRAFASAMGGLLSNDTRREAMRERAYGLTDAAVVLSSELFCRLYWVMSLGVV
ncbi:hypothetical protein GCM10007874_35780 [Labrys miyagiensis]|uniref:Uncharacterized protein n=1 Tax=Labrys miyagiensis TaxID=346912 RepID=A0ABQ6CJL4_9HYPH|nr:hypothetical protein [Labrys miyagiensis]GLS20561.1 hypothetical protein GCM10007874_35780 [Labrys miyagiensis]